MWTKLHHKLRLIGVYFTDVERFFYCKENVKDLGGKAQKMSLLSPRNYGCPSILSFVNQISVCTPGNASKGKSKEFNLDGLLSQNIDSLRNFVQSVPSDSLNLRLEKQVCVAIRVRVRKIIKYRASFWVLIFRSAYKSLI